VVWVQQFSTGVLPLVYVRTFWYVMYGVLKDTILLYILATTHTKDQTNFMRVRINDIGMWTY
jgi:hypothetical protein